MSAAAVSLINAGIIHSASAERQQAESELREWNRVDGMTANIQQRGKEKRGGDAVSVVVPGLRKEAEEQEKHPQAQVLPFGLPKCISHVGSRQKTPVETAQELMAHK